MQALTWLLVSRIDYGIGPTVPQQLSKIVLTMKWVFQWCEGKRNGEIRDISVTHLIANGYLHTVSDVVQRYYRGELEKYVVLILDRSHELTRGSIDEIDETSIDVVIARDKL
ncbi:hypothetical protein TWF679_011310 [Orbilia oligospora]|uniref:Uncharacterized protein n=1 Tax=Orbilia oligospora TaxID=2813651 RepID=A0A8H8UYB2_ORBOL|nr:hypothetical protein TWF679_011310 [Orbilia oligospora]